MYVSVVMVLMDRSTACTNLWVVDPSATLSCPSRQFASGDVLETFDDSLLEVSVCHYQ